MKSVDFFIDKANEYIETATSLSLNLIPRLKFSDGINKSYELEAQERNLSDLYLKVRLLFSEFENGDIFFSELKPMYDETGLSKLFPNFEEDKLTKTKHILELFIGHINEFKKEAL
ncbi:hypothetical protein ACFS6H_14285 [Terrimonas rubra]|uniref:Uncharacterized protein n=1 Tax=Terrimonas rubra TaxID=1035890 RepID=A0ABW6AAY5_9BACT